MIVWLSSYPRSGNTFARTLIRSCLGHDTYSIYNDADIGSDSHLAQLTGHQQLAASVGEQGFDLADIRESEKTVFLKTHEPDRSFVEGGDKVIYLIRDGRHATMSFKEYLRNYHDTDASFSEILLGAHFPGKNWADHVAAWRPDETSNTLLVRFDELTSRPAETARDIGAFTGLPVLSEELPAFQELHAVNAKFFSRGASRARKEELPDRDLALFLVLSLEECRRFDYLQAMPEPFAALDAEALMPLSEAARWLSTIHQKRLGEAETTAAGNLARLDQLAGSLDTLTGLLTGAEARAEEAEEKAAAQDRARALADGRNAELEAELQRRDSLLCSKERKIEILTRALRGIPLQLNADI